VFITEKQRAEMAFVSLSAVLMGSVVDKCRKYDQLKE
jgi:hypothetical protein